MYKNLDPHRTGTTDVLVRKSKAVCVLDEKQE